MFDAPHHMFYMMQKITHCVIYASCGMNIHTSYLEKIQQIVMESTPEWDGGQT